MMHGHKNIKLNKYCTEWKPVSNNDGLTRSWEHEVFQGVLTSGDVFGLEMEDTAERDKRQIKEPATQAKFSIKSALLNIIFGVMFTFLLQYKLTLTWPTEGKPYTALYSLRPQNLTENTQDKDFLAFDAVKIGRCVSVVYSNTLYASFPLW